MSALPVEPSPIPVMPPVLVHGYEHPAPVQVCAEPNCLRPAALTLNDVGRCVPCHRARNGGRVVWG